RQTPRLNGPAAQLAEAAEQASANKLAPHRHRQAPTFLRIMNFPRNSRRRSGPVAGVLLDFAAAQLQVSQVAQSPTIEATSKRTSSSLTNGIPTNLPIPGLLTNLDSVDDCGDDTRRSPPARADDDDWVRLGAVAPHDLRQALRPAAGHPTSRNGDAAVTNDADFSDRQAGSDATTRCSFI
uniref:Kinesin motor domain-containing protein n=1 Tax=Macrostomum lignano TaxID=282301 RepID=A0A1I8F7B4_9PLAT